MRLIKCKSFTIIILGTLILLVLTLEMITKSYRNSNLGNLIDDTDTIEPKSLRSNLVENTKRAFQSLRSHLVDVTKVCSMSHDVIDTCAGSFYDIANWTLHLHNDDCIKLLDVRHDCKYAIKKVVFSNGTEVYKGCTKQTSRCSQKPYFNEKFQVRVNVPPCCRKHLMDLFQKVADAFQKSNIPYFLVAGGLLGFVRYKHLIPYDNDLDLVVGATSWNAKSFKIFLNDISDREDFIVSFVKRNKLKIEFSKKNRISIDVWPYEVSKRGKLLTQKTVKLKSSTFRYKELNYNEVFPLRRVFFGGVQTFVPNKADYIVGKEYGPLYMQELTCKKKTVHNFCAS